MYTLQFPLPLFYMVFGQMDFFRSIGLRLNGLRSIGPSPSDDSCGRDETRKVSLKVLSFSLFDGRTYQYMITQLN